MKSSCVKYIFILLKLKEASALHLQPLSHQSCLVSSKCCLRLHEIFIKHSQQRRNHAFQTSEIATIMSGRAVELWAARSGGLIEKGVKTRQRSRDVSTPQSQVKLKKKDRKIKIIRITDTCVIVSLTNDK